MRSLSNLSAAAAFLCLAIFGTPAMACHEGDDTATCESSHTPAGVPLAALKHDQVMPLYNHFPAILKAAHTMANNQAWQGQAREEFLDILTFTRNTYGNAWWGYAPGDVLNSDTNPWHLPTHAYLRGAYELLMRMHQAEPANPAVTQLYDTVNNAIFNMMSTCYYSSTTFSTLDDVTPDWSRTDTTPYLQALAAMGLLLAGVFGVGLAAHRRKSLTYVHQLHYT